MAGAGSGNGGAFEFTDFGCRVDMVDGVKIRVAHSQQPQYGIAYEATAIIILLPCRQQYSNKYII